jgi:hypothetical protein
MSLGKAGRRSAEWRKARRSMGNGNCVEIRPMNGAIAVRDSKNPNGNILEYNAESWRTFTQNARQGSFDSLQ